MAQFLLPDGTISDDGYTLAGDTTVHACIDEGIASADELTTAIRSGTNVTNKQATVSLSDPSGTPGAGDQIISARWRKNSSTGRLVQGTLNLIQGASTVIATVVASDLTDTWTTTTYTLTGGEVGNITDYNDLRLQVVADVTGTGGGRELQVTAVEFEVPDATGGTQFNQAAAGALATAGGIAKQDQTVKAGTLTSSGALIKETRTAKSGTLSTAGSLAKQAQKAFTGTLTTSGALNAIKIAFQIIGGTLSMAGNLVNQGRKSLDGLLSTSGMVSKSTDKSLDGDITPSGTMIKQTIKAFAGTLSISGALNGVKTALKSVGGTLSLAGNLVKQGKKSLSGQVSPSGLLIKQGQKILSGALSSAGTLIRDARKSLAGTITSSGFLEAEKTALADFFQEVGGALSFVGTLVKSPQKSLSGSISPSGILSRRISILLSGSLSIAGAVAKRIDKTFSGAISWTGGLVSQFNAAPDEADVTYIANVTHPTRTIFKKLRPHSFIKKRFTIKHPRGD